MKHLADFEAGKFTPLFVLIGILLDNFPLWLLVSIACIGYTTDFAHIGFKACGIYAIDGIFLHIIHSFLCQCLCYLKYKRATVGFFLIAIAVSASVLCCEWIGYSTLSDSHIETMKQVGYFNWRVDLPFMEFEFDHGCRGLNIAGDNCSLSKNSYYIKCCDEYFVSAVDKEAKRLKDLFIAAGSVSIISIVLYYVFFPILVAINCV